jgi:hypothetical protein
MEALFDTIRRGYTSKDLWLKTGKRICHSFIGIYPRFDWAQTFEAMIKEMIAFERPRGNQLNGESYEDFFLRLAFKQKENNEIDLNEYSNFSCRIAKLSHEADLSHATLNPTFYSITAKARLLKTCLEIGRKRSAHSDRQLSVHKLMVSPIEIPLDLGPTPPFWDALAVFGFRPSQVNSFQINYDRITSSPEYHFAVAHNFGLFEYLEAVRRIALEHSSLEEAYVNLSTKCSLDEFEKHFFDLYPKMKESASVDWKKWL